MKKKYYNRFQIESSIAALLYLLLLGAVLGSFEPSSPRTLVIVALTLLLALYWSARLFRGLQRDSQARMRNSFAQQEALAGLYRTLPVSMPLPPLRGTAASPDFLALLAREILERRPTVIAELGSGCSTLIAAYCLRKLGEGRLISLDHLQKYADITRANVAAHGLSDLADVRHAPLTEHRIDGVARQWYDAGLLADAAQIDLLIVDGPPAGTGDLARYPAVPVLKEKLAADCVILLDDGQRSDEGRVVELWQEQLSIRFDYVTLEKGAYIGRRG